MSLFGKKKEEKKEAKCGYSCGCGCDTAEAKETTAPTPCCGEKVDGICCIKVLGSGCKNCHALYENAQEAAKAAGLNIEVEYITDLQKVMEYGVMLMPALVINEQVVSMGKVLKTEDLIRKTSSGSWAVTATARSRR